MAGFKNKAVRPDLSRPVADLDRTGITREWRDVEAQDLAEGDIVAGFGVVVSTQPTCRDEVALEVGKPNANMLWLNKTDIVKAFVKKGN